MPDLGDASPLLTATPLGSSAPAPATAQAAIPPVPLDDPDLAFDAEDGVEPLEALLELVRYLKVYRRLLVSFVVNDLRFRYAGSSVGFFWTVIDPILELAIYTFVFSVLLKVRFAPEGDTLHYALFLFSGIVVWFNLQETFSRCTSILSEHAPLIRKLYFPAAILPSHVVLSGLVNQAIRTGILLISIALAGYGISFHVLLVPLLMGLQALFTVGIGMALATASVYFKDLAHMVKVGLMVWMFITPIFYPPTSYPREFQVLLVLNPLAHLVGMYQELLLNNRLPHQGSIIIFSVAALFSFILGGYLFSRHQDRFSDLV